MQPAEPAVEGTVSGVDGRAGRAPIALVSTVDAVTVDVRERILTLTWAAGARLPESALAKEYGVSRHTLRAALARLTASGLLKFNANHGWSVPLLTMDDFQDILFLRVGLEVQAMREIARLGQGLSAEATAALDEIRATSDDPDWVEALRVDMRFHLALVEQAGRPRLSVAYRDVQTALQLYLVERREWFGTQSVAAWKAVHEQIATVLRSGDPDRIDQTLRSIFSYEMDGGDASTTPD